MKKGKRTVAVILSAVMLVSIFSACSNKAPAQTQTPAQVSSDSNKFPTMTIQIGHTNSSIESDYKQKLGTLFGEYISEATGGAVTIQVLGDSQLGKENELTEGLQLGMIDMAVLSSPTFSNFDDMHLFTELPFLFDSTPAARAFLATGEYAEMNDSIVDKLGIRFLTTGELGFRYVINNKKPINKVADMAGLKLRTPETEIVLGIFSGLGANPTPMAISETLTAIQQGTIDGAEFPVGTIYSGGYHDVTKYLSKTNHQYTLCYLAISESFYETLDPQLQKIFNEAAAYAQKGQFEFIDKIEAEQLQAFVDAGMEINDISDPQEFKDAVSVVHEVYREKIGADFYDKAMEAVNACNEKNS